METSINEGRAPTTNRAASGSRSIRSGSILRRTSTSTRQSSNSSTTLGASGVTDLPAARHLRQSQYPPISGSGAANVVLKAPRKSIGPGLIDSDYMRPAQKRRPSLISNSSAGGLSDTGASTRVNIGGAPSYTDGARGLTASRAAKAKSLQPPLRQGQTHLAVGTPEHNRSSSFTGRSPGRTGGRATNTPSSSAKRMSVMPGAAQSSHATGLGARTISPTDARRAKRLSILQNAPPMPRTPPTPQPDISTIRTTSRSPSMLPRKVSTPSSSRTTPDISNRKSYSSGLSIASSASYNTSRTSTGSLQARASLPPISSRLPTPKPRNVHSSAGNNEEEEVPPVPAIPKAYESPKESPAEPSYFNKWKSNMPFDASSINSTSTNSLSGKAYIRDPVKNEREPKYRQYAAIASNSDIEQQHNNAAPAKKKNLQPLRLPPMNLLPLSTPTASKIAALQDLSLSDGQVTPPPRRITTKTLSTPMTASKDSFTSRNRHDDGAELNSQHMQSNGSTHHLRSGSPSQVPRSSSESTQPISINGRSQRHAVSPFVSSLLPKNSDEMPYMPRSKTSGDFSSIDTATGTRPSRLTGPRAPKLTKSSKTDSPNHVSSSEEPTTPSSTSSLRRKLSLGWKRTNSKSNINNVSHAASERGSEYSKHDNMPPPKLPASATANNLSNITVPSPSPSINSTTYLDSKRRKSSASSLGILSGHDRTRSDSWGISGSPKKEQLSDIKGEKSLPPSRGGSSMTTKMLHSKGSASTVRAADPWSIDLDKDDLLAEDEMKKLGLKRKETEIAARQLDALRKRATPKDRVSPEQALQVAHNLNLFERGEIVDYKDVYFCGTQAAAKHVGELSADAANFGYDDERGDYTIAVGDHLSYRYEIVDILGKGSFGQVVRCIDHKTGVLVAIKIIRNKKRFHQQALVEVNILQKLREWVSLFSPAQPSNADLSRTPKISTVWSTSLRASTSATTFAYLPSC